MSASDEAVERAERAIIDAIEAQFDIHAMEAEDWAEMSVAIRRAIDALANHTAAMKEALEEAREAIASLPEDALGSVYVTDAHTGEHIPGYPVRDELLEARNGL